MEKIWEIHKFLLKIVNSSHPPRGKGSSINMILMGEGCVKYFKFFIPNFLSLYVKLRTTGEGVSKH